MASRLAMFWISHHFLQLIQACIHNGYKLDHAMIKMKWRNQTFDRGSSYYKISVEVLKDKDCIQDVKNMLLEVQVDCENKSKNFSGNMLQCSYAVFSLAYSYLLAKSHKNTATLQSKLDKI